MAKIEYSPDAFSDLEQIGDYIAILFPALPTENSSEDFPDNIENE